MNQDLFEQLNDFGGKPENKSPIINAVKNFLSKEIKKGQSSSRTKIGSVKGEKTPGTYALLDKEGSSSSKLKTFDTLNWLKKRYSSQMPNEYSFNETERQRYFAIQEIFKKFDTDGTGTLDVREL